MMIEIKKPKDIFSSIIEEDTYEEDPEKDNIWEENPTGDDDDDDDWDEDEEYDSDEDEEDEEDSGDTIPPPSHDADAIRWIHSELPWMAIGLSTPTPASISPPVSTEHQSVRLAVPEAKYQDIGRTLFSVSTEDFRMVPPARESTDEESTPCPLADVYEAGRRYEESLREERHRRTEEHRERLLQHTYTMLREIRDYQRWINTQSAFEISDLAHSLVASLEVIQKIKDCYKSEPARQ